MPESWYWFAESEQKLFSRVYVELRVYIERLNLKKINEYIAEL